MKNLELDKEHLEQKKKFIQLKKKEYVEKFKRENNNHSILAVAICYDSKIKEHYCKIEELR